MIETTGSRLTLLIEPVRRQLILSGYHDLATRLEVSLGLACEPEYLIGCLTLTLNDIYALYVGTTLNVSSDVKEVQDFIEQHFHGKNVVEQGIDVTVSLPGGAIEDVDSANSTIRGILARLDFSGNHELELGLYQAWRFTFSSGEFYGELKDELTKILDADLPETVGIGAATSSVLLFVTQTLDIMNGKL